MNEVVYVEGGRLGEVDHDSAQPHRELFEIVDGDIDAVLLQKDISLEAGGIDVDVPVGRIVHALVDNPVGAKPVEVIVGLAHGLELEAEGRGAGELAQVRHRAGAAGSIAGFVPSTVDERV